MADVPLMNNPMTTSQDIIKGGASGAPSRLAVGSNGDVLTVTAGSVGWAAPAGGSTTFHGVRALQSTNTNLTNGSVVYIGFDGTDDYDTDAYHDPASNNTRLTVPTGLGGKYTVSAFSFITSSPGNGFSVIRKNGTTIVAAGPLVSNTGAGMTNCVTTLDLAQADYLEFGIQVGATSKQSLDAGLVDPTFEMHKVG